jgi:hypothetical protein
MDLTNKGVGQYGEAYSQVPALNPTSLFINPTDQAQMDLQKLMQTQSLNSQAAIQAANRASQERMQGNSLAASGSQFSRSMDASQKRFDQERKDALDAMSSSNNRLQGIIDRNSGGGTGSGYGSGYGSGSGGGSSYSWGNWGSQPTIQSVDPGYYGSSSGYNAEDAANAAWAADYGQDYYAGEDAANAAYADFYNDW